MKVETETQDCISYPDHLQLLRLRFGFTLNTPPSPNGLSPFNQKLYAKALFSVGGTLEADGVSTEIVKRTICDFYHELVASEGD